VINRHVAGVYISVEIVIASMVCFVIGFKLSSFVHHRQSIIGGFWCLIATTTVLHLSIKDSYSACLQIAEGALIGSAIAFFLTSLYGYQYYVMFLAVALSVLITLQLGYGAAVKMSSANAGVIVALGIYQPAYTPLANAGLRLAEVLIGSAVALVLIYISKWFKVRD
jgi:uncharacterized membrane protein YgaE (UPF0421/DUF939 family)